MQAYPPLAFACALAIGAAGWWMQRQLLRPLQVQVAAERASLAALDAEIAREQQRTTDATRRQADTERSTAERAAFDASPGRLWISRVEVLQQLLTELPAQRIPEIRLLGPLDWVDLVRKSELDTPENLRAALAAARARGRQKLVHFLQEALQRYADAKEGALPSDIAELSPFLSPPADATMLERYNLTRSGQLGARDENLIVEKSVSDMILSVSLNGWSMTNGPNLLPAPGESEIAALQRAAGAMGGAIDAGASEEAEQFARSIREIAEKAAAEFGRVFEDHSDDDFKRAVKGYMAAHPDVKPTNFAELLPYLSHADQFIDALRPLFAQIEYLRDHQGALPSDPAQLRPYLARFDPQKAFRDMKLEVTDDGEHGSMNFSIGPK